jgi:peptidoglycan/LPS O-acetylase OafA/YrhL
MNDLVSIDQEKQRIYFPELDGLRFFAFLLVFVHHHKLFSGIPYLSIFYTNGWIGVDLFFALSAFLFTKLLIAEYNKTKSISFKKFYIRRVFRIWPLYFLFVGISITLYFFSDQTFTNTVRIRILGLFTFSDNIFSAISGYNPLPYVAHLWTIAFEEQFYVIIPVMIYFLVRSSLKTKLISLLTAVLLFNIIRIIFILNKVPHPAIWVLPITHFESILLGMVIGFGGFEFFLKRLKPIIFALIGVVFFIILSFLPHIEKNSFWLIASYSIVGISTSMVLFSVLMSNFLKAILSNKIFVFLGKRSYGLYVFHLLGNGIASYMIAYVPGIPKNLMASFIYSLSFTIVASVLSYKFIETHFLNFKKKFEVILTRPV